MKSHFLTVVVLLFGTLCPEVFAQNVNKPQSCCFKFQKTVIPRRYIVAYEMTRDDCPNLGVILIGASGRTVCASPNDAWVVRHMNYFDRLALQAPQTTTETPK
ncbi:C-C motif chemokine 5-like isoform X2 [Erpetoichthys calabaricus]|uniref:C-C motif chemokine 5-like isoform X2 n=1 Tax=Erpetoichthys calabaricus TaxID=27687 RepID=UPI0010A00C70|nr:C-C motif chemokine 5-like isoform X2 [Erpetoichthys calabaricus]